MYDTDGKLIRIVTEDEIEDNKMDDLTETIDLTKIVEEASKEVSNNE